MIEDNSDKLMMKKILIFTLFLVFPALIYAESSQTGYASWYGGKFQGRKTANGEIFDTYKYTAAHKTLPFDTILKVKNLENGKTVVVRVNDRGPFVKNRILDLSYAAAEDIGMIKSGTAKVKIQVVESSTSQSDRYSYKIQVAAYSSLKNARNTLKNLKKNGITPELEKSSKGIYRIVIKNIEKDKLNNIKGKLQKCGFSKILVKKEVKI